jgi:hypothetical protein
MRILIVLLMLIVVPSVFASPNFEVTSRAEDEEIILGGIKDYCTDIYPKDKEAIKICQDIQIASVDLFYIKYGNTIESLTKALDKFGKDKNKDKKLVLSQDERIIAACYSRYRMPKYGIANYFKVMMCVDLLHEKIKQRTY